MNDNQKERLHRFASDPIMLEVVSDMLIEQFMKKKEGDVYQKAAQMMAIDMLKDALKEVERYKNNQQSHAHKQLGI